MKLNAGKKSLKFMLAMLKTTTVTRNKCSIISFTQVSKALSNLNKQSFIIKSKSKQAINPYNKQLTNP